MHNQFMPDMLQRVSGGKRETTKWQWHEFVEKKAHRGRLWEMMGKEPYVREMWEYFCQERARVKRFRDEAEEERPAGIQGQWQLESPARGYLEQVKCCNDTDCTHRMMKQGFLAFKSGVWKKIKYTFRNEVKVSAWAFDRIKEAFEKVAKDEARKLSTVQEIMISSTDYLRRINAPAERQGGVSMSYLCPHCNSFPMEGYVWWVSGRKGRNDWWCAICGEKWLEATIQALVQTGESVNQAKVSRALQSACSTPEPLRKSD